MNLQLKTYPLTTVEISDMDALHTSIAGSGTVGDFGGLFLEGTNLFIIGDSLIDEAALDIIVNAV